MKDLVIIGAGGFAREVAWLVEEINNSRPTWNLLGYLDENRASGEEINGLPILGNMAWLDSRQSGITAVCAIGDPRTRRRIVESLRGQVAFAALVDPSVKMSSSVSIGLGTIICAGSIATVNVSIGNHVVVNLDCTLGHDSILHDFCSLMPSVNVSGGVTLGEGAYCGTGVQIIQGKTVGPWTTIGAGAVVVNDLAKMVLAVGVPAKVVKALE